MEKSKASGGARAAFGTPAEHQNQATTLRDCARAGAVHHLAMSAALLWCKVSALEFPPAGEDVWTTDGSAVRQGAWHWEAPHMPLEQGVWQNTTGAVIVVTHWLPLEESNTPPEPPAPFTLPRP